MRRPGIGELNLGALAGAVVGSIGGLFAPGVASAIMSGNPRVLFAMPILGGISCVISGIVGWLVGGQIGPRVGQKFGRLEAELVGGVLGGLVPVVLIVLWGYYMVTRGG